MGFDPDPNSVVDPVAMELGPPPPLDPELTLPLQAILDQLPMPLTSSLIEDRRNRTADSSVSDEVIRHAGDFEIQELLVPGPNNSSASVPVLFCRPTATAFSHAVIFNIHGGGMVAGNNRSIELVDELDRAAQLHAAVIAVDYRLAPEHPAPAALDDCYAALVWIDQNARQLGIDNDRIIVSGNSAGGGLAAGLALRVRDRGGPRLIGQMLQCPMLDDRCRQLSVTQLWREGLWDGSSNMAGWNALLGDQRGGAGVSHYIAPARATNLSNLAPAYIDGGSVEALRDEAVEFASRIWQAGGQAELHIWAGAFHSFDLWVPDAAVARAAKSARLSWLSRVLAS